MPTRKTVNNKHSTSSMKTPAVQGSKSSGAGKGGCICAHPDGLHAAVGRQEKQIQRIQIQVLEDLLHTASNVIVVTYLHASSMLSGTRHKALRLKTRHQELIAHIICTDEDANWPFFCVGD